MNDCKHWCTLTEWCHSCKAQGARNKRTIQYTEHKSRYARRNFEGK